MKIWHRYLGKKVLIRLFFLLIAFFLLYVLIDYTNHTGHFHHKSTRPSIEELFLYYLAKFFLELDLILPFAFLMASVSVLGGLNLHKELLALFSAKISPFRIALPLFGVALLCTLFLLINSEFISPGLAKKNQTLIESHVIEKNLQEEKNGIHKLLLNDNSLLLFKQSRPDKRHFDDLLWILTPDHLFRMASLEIDGGRAKAYDVEEFLRTAEGTLEIAHRHESLELAGFFLDPDQLRESFGKEEELSLTALLERMVRENPESERGARVRTEWVFRLLFFLLSPLSLLAILPDCFSFTRGFSTLKVMTKGLLLLAFLIVTMNALSTLSYRQIASPDFTLILPFSLFSILCIIRFYGSLRFKKMEKISKVSQKG